MAKELTFTRRKALTALGAVGAASVGAGLGTSAYFSDQETFQNNEIVAGRTDLRIDWQQTLAQSPSVDVNAYPDPDGDGTQSFGGVAFGGPAEERLARAHDIPDVCGTCGEPKQLGLQQGGRNVCIEVIRGTQSVEAFYDYRGLQSDATGDQRFSSANPAIQAGDAARVFVYEEPSGDRYLVFVFGGVGEGPGGRATFQFDGLEQSVGATPWVLRDDPADSYSATEASWRWGAGRTDGGIVGPLEPAAGHDGYCVVTDPDLTTISNLQVLSGDTNTVVDLDPTQTFTICDTTGLVSGTELQTPDVFQSEQAPDQQHLIEVTDVKPGDAGKTNFSIHVCDIESYVWLFADNFTEAENGVTEPEADDPDEDGTQASPGSDPELADALRIRLWYDDDCDESQNGSEKVLFEGSLTDAMALLTQTNQSGVPGIPLDADRSTTYAEYAGSPPTVDDGVDAARECFPAQSTVCVGVEWWLPEDHANEVQTDSVGFDLGFYAEQCAANDGSGRAPEV